MDLIAFRTITIRALIHRSVPRALLLAASLLAVPVLAVAADVRTAVVAFALWSDQGVFLSEATQGSGLLSRRYGAVATVVRGNTRARMAAGPAAMAAAIAQADKALDPERDVLFVLVTSHGSPEGLAERGGGAEGVLAPDRLAEILGRGRTRRKVLIVSACFSGIYTALARPDLLVITAADAGHPSFGCTAGAKWTYFGQAFFDTALRRSIGTGEPLDAVFGHAATLVRARELREGFEPSNPQMAGGSNVLEALATIRTR